MNDSVIKPQHGFVVVDDAKATRKRVDALLIVMHGILDVLKESPDGASGGHIHAALMTIGINIHQFEQIMSMLKQARRVRNVGHLWFYVEPAAPVLDGVQPAVQS